MTKRQGDESARLRVVVALSGGGRTLTNLLARQKTLAYQIVGVISSSPSCRGNALAKEAGLPLFVGNFCGGHTPAASGLHPGLPPAGMDTWLAERGAGLIALCGFLKVFPLHHPLAGCVVNIHPALLPRFGGQGMYGMRVHEAVIAAGEKESGATIHQVTERYDEGRILAQATVALAPGETAHSLATKVFAAECDLYPQVLHKLALGELSLASGLFRYPFTPSNEPQA